MKEARDLVDRREFVFVSVTYRREVPVGRFNPFGIGHDFHKFVVVGTHSVVEAREVAARYAAERWEGEPEINCYPRTYIRDARALVAQGEYVEVGGLR